MVVKVYNFQIENKKERTIIIRSSQMGSMYIEAPSVIIV